MALGFLRRGVAEFVGTFALIFIAAGATIYGDLVGLAFASGLVIAVMVTSVGHISGGHFNPAVTLGFLVTRRIAPLNAVLYWIVQFGAAALAALLLKWVLPTGAAANLGAPTLNPEVDPGQGVAIEATLTFFLLWVVFAMLADERGTMKQVAGLAIGLTITFGTLMAAGLTGAAMNPARAFGPELVANDWADFWVWYVGPLAGAVIAAVVYEVLYLHGPETEAPPVEPDEPAFEPGEPASEPAEPPATGDDEPATGTAALD